MEPGWRAGADARLFRRLPARAGDERHALRDARRAASRAGTGAPDRRRLCRRLPGNAGLVAAVQPPAVGRRGGRSDFRCRAVAGAARAAQGHAVAGAGRRAGPARPVGLPGHDAVGRGALPGAGAGGARRRLRLGAGLGDGPRALDAGGQFEDAGSHRGGARLAARHPEARQSRSRPLRCAPVAGGAPDGGAGRRDGAAHRPGGGHARRGGAAGAGRRPP